MIEYQHEAPADDEAAIAATRAHVRHHLAAIADADDDPATRADDAQVWVVEHPDNPERVIVRGQIDADPVAEYLDPAYSPLAGLDPDLLAEALGIEPQGAPRGA